MSSTIAAWMPWTDRAGRLSWLKLAFFVGLAAPAVWMFCEWRFDWLSPRPRTDLIRESGDWALRILVASLAVTPLRFVTKFNKLILVRRALGLAALFYTLGHVALWCVDENYEWATIFWEMMLRMFLTVGLVSTLMLVILGATSNDWGIKKLGAKNWNRVHAWTYAATGLGVLHYFMESKLDVTEAVVLGGLFMLAMAFRVARKWLQPRFFPLAGAAVVSALLTAGVEAFYYGASTRVSVSRVLWANLDFTYSIRPAWWVLAVGIAVALLSIFRARATPNAARKR